jgi:hypothetical protein
VQTVLFCIGSGGVNDFTNIQALLATQEGTLTLKRNFSALASAMPIDGYDFDDEDLYDADTIAGLTEALCAGNQLIITYCPYTAQDTWNQALQDVYTWDQQHNPVLGQSVRWWNLQCYSGGDGNDPASWAPGPADEHRHRRSPRGQLGRSMTMWCSTVRRARVVSKSHARRYCPEPGNHSGLTILTMRCSSASLSWRSLP